MTWLRTLPFVLAFAMFLGGCGASTKVSTVWVTPDPPAEPFNRVLALVINASPGERRAGEDVLAAAISNNRGVPAYTIVKDDQIKDRDAVKAAAKHAGCDAAAVVKLVSSDKVTTYVPPTYNSLHDPMYDGYNSLRPIPEYRPGYTTTDTYVTAETSFYSLRNDSLVWAGSSTTMNPGSIKDLVEQVCRGSVEELKKQGLIRESR